MVYSESKVYTVSGAREARLASLRGDARAATEPPPEEPIYTASDVREMIAEAVHRERDRAIRYLNRSRDVARDAALCIQALKHHDPEYAERERAPTVHPAEIGLCCVKSDGPELARVACGGRR